MLRANALLFLISFFLLTNSLFGQDFTAIDQRASTFNAVDDPATTAHLLVAPYETELEKARAIFTYVATSMKYDCKEFHRKPADRKARTRDQVLHRAYRGLGVRAGYAHLFDVMSKAAGLNSEIVRGTSRIGNQRYNPERMPSNHAWNAIEIDGEWHLLDVTWASGYTNPEVTRFTPAFSDRLFLQNPETFFLKHYPAEQRWQLLDTPRTPEQFLNQPSVYRLPDGWMMDDYAPRAGMLPSSEEVLVFRIKITGPEKMFLTMGERRFEMTETEDGHYEYTLPRADVRGRSLILRALKESRIRPIIGYRIER